MIMIVITVFLMVCDLLVIAMVVPNLVKYMPLRHLENVSMTVVSKEWTHRRRDTDSGEEIERISRWKMRNNQTGLVAYFEAKKHLKKHRYCS